MVEKPEGTSGSCKLAGDKGSIAPAMMQSFYWTLRERKSSKPSFSDELKMGLSNKGRVKTSQVNTVCTGIIFFTLSRKGWLYLYFRWSSKMPRWLVSLQESALGQVTGSLSSSLFNTRLLVNI